MDAMDQDPYRNKRKPEDDILEVRVAKHTCLCSESDIQLDSNSYSEVADSVMSMSDDSLLHTSSSSSSSSSVNWSGETKASSASTLPASEDISSLEYDTKHSMEDFFCSNNSVLSSGRWNVNQDAEQGTEKQLTIDKEFEQYFSMLML